MTEPDGDSATVWEVVRALPVCRLQVVPRRRSAGAETADRDEWRDQRLAALVSAYHAGSGAGRDAVLVGWRRAQAYGPTEVLIGGEALIIQSRLDELGLEPSTETHEVLISLYGVRKSAARPHP